LVYADHKALPLEVWALMTHGLDQTNERAPTHMPQRIGVEALLAY
jgi:hypothetical protein